MWERLLLQAPSCLVPSCRLALLLQLCFYLCSPWATGEPSAPVWSLTCRILAGGSSVFGSQGLAGQGWDSYQASVRAAACGSLCEQSLTACVTS